MWRMWSAVAIDRMNARPISISNAFAFISRIIHNQSDLMAFSILMEMRNR